MSLSLSWLSSRWFKIVLSLTLLAILLLSADLQAFFQQIRSAHLGYFLLTFVGYLAGQVLSAYKWQLLAKALGFDTIFRAFVSYYFVGMYLNLFAPSTIAGDLGRGFFLAGGRYGAGRALQSVLADRVSGVVMLVWVSALGFIFLGPTVLPALMCYGTITVAGGTVIAWWLLPRGVARLFGPEHRVRQFSDKLLGPYHDKPGLMLYVCGISLCFHVFQISLMLLLAYALGIRVPFWYLILCVPPITVLSTLPISFGGLGVREGGYVFFLSLVSILQDQALALSLLWTALIFGAGLVGGLVLAMSPDIKSALVTVATSQRLNPSEIGASEK